MALYETAFDSASPACDEDPTESVLETSRRLCSPDPDLARILRPSPSSSRSSNESCQRTTHNRRSPALPLKKLFAPWTCTDRAPESPSENSTTSQCNNNISPTEEKTKTFSPSVEFKKLDVTDESKQKPTMVDNKSRFEKDCIKNATSFSSSTLHNNWTKNDESSDTNSIDSIDSATGLCNFGPDNRMKLNARISHMDNNFNVQPSTSLNWNHCDRTLSNRNVPDNRDSNLNNQLPLSIHHTDSNINCYNRPSMSRSLHSFVVKEDFRKNSTASAEAKVAQPFSVKFNCDSTTNYGSDSSSLSVENNKFTFQKPSCFPNKYKNDSDVKCGLKNSSSDNGNICLGGGPKHDLKIAVGELKCEGDLTNHTRLPREDMKRANLSSPDAGTRTNLWLDFSRAPKRRRRHLYLDICSSEKGSDVESTEHLLNQGWYHGSISRSDAENLLRVMNKGSFLVRSSEKSKRQYLLSLKSSRGVMHVKIVQVRNKYVIKQQSQAFDSIPELVQYFSNHVLNIHDMNVYLSHPVIEKLL